MSLTELLLATLDSAASGCRSRGMIPVFLPHLEQPHNPKPIPSVQPSAPKWLVRFTKNPKHQVHCQAWTPHSSEMSAIRNLCSAFLKNTSKGFVHDAPHMQDPSKNAQAEAQIRQAWRDCEQMVGCHVLPLT